MNFLNSNCSQLTSSTKQGNEQIEQVEDRPIIHNSNLLKDEGLISLGLTDWFIIVSCSLSIINNSLSFRRKWRKLQKWLRRSRST